MNQPGLGRPRLPAPPASRTRSAERWPRRESNPHARGQHGLSVPRLPFRHGAASAPRGSRTPTPFGHDALNVARIPVPPSAPDRCAERESNPHASRHRALDPARIPIPPSAHTAGGDAHGLMRQAGVEPARRAAPCSKHGASAVPPLAHSGRGGGRTRSLGSASAALSRLSYTPEGGWRGTRTPDDARSPDLQSGALAAARSIHECPQWRSNPRPRVFSAVLRRLSYRGGRRADSGRARPCGPDRCRTRDLLDAIETRSRCATGPEPAARPDRSGNRRLRRPGSNRRASPYEGGALPTELLRSKPKATTRTPIIGTCLRAAEPTMGLEPIRFRLQDGCSSR